MNGTEFLDRFNVLYNNITSNQAPGLDPYEICVLLTKAQDEVLKNHFLPQSNPKQAGFDDNQKRQIDFSSLMMVTNATQISNPSSLGNFYPIDERSKVFLFPADVYMIINETYKVTSTSTTLQVIPLKFDEYTRLMSKPYKRPLKNQAWRLINQGTFNPNAEIVAGSKRMQLVELIAGPGSEEALQPIYKLRYIRKPKPIIAADLDGLTINGFEYGGDSTPDDPEEIEENKVYGDNCCELDPSIHEEILQRAVELAKVAWQGDLNATIQTGQRSE